MCAAAASSFFLLLLVRPLLLPPRHPPRGSPLLVCSRVRDGRLILHFWSKGGEARFLARLLEDFHSFHVEVGEEERPLLFVDAVLCLFFFWLDLPRLTCPLWIQCLLRLSVWPRRTSSSCFAYLSSCPSLPYPYSLLPSCSPMRFHVQVSF